MHVYILLQVTVYFSVVFAPLQTEMSQLQSENDELAASKDAIVAEISRLQVGSIWSSACTVRTCTHPCAVYVALFPGTPPSEHVMCNL